MTWYCEHCRATFQSNLDWGICPRCGKSDDDNIQPLEDVPDDAPSEDVEDILNEEMP